MPRSSEVPGIWPALFENLPTSSGLDLPNEPNPCGNVLISPCRISTLIVHLGYRPHTAAPHPPRQQAQAPPIEERRIRRPEIAPDLGAADVDGGLIPLAPGAIRSTLASGSRGGKERPCLAIPLRVERIAAVTVKRGEDQVCIRPRRTTAGHDSARCVHHHVLLQPVASVARTRRCVACGVWVPRALKRPRDRIGVHAVRERVPVFGLVAEGQPVQSLHTAFHRRGTDLGIV